MIKGKQYRSTIISIHLTEALRLERNQLHVFKR